MSPNEPTSERRHAAFLSVDDDMETYRPRNRRRKRRGLRSTERYQVRLAVMAAGGIFAAYVAFLLIQKIIHPYRLGHEVGQQVTVLKTRLDREEAENTALRQRIVFLRSKEGAEVTARRDGYHRKGETVYLLPVAADSPDAAMPAAAQ